jgi:hypothetical protein
MQKKNAHLHGVENPDVVYQRIEKQGATKEC